MHRVDRAELVSIPRKLSKLAERNQIELTKIAETLKQRCAQTIFFNGSRPNSTWRLGWSRNQFSRSCCCNDSFSESKFKGGGEAVGHLLIRRDEKECGIDVGRSSREEGVVLVVVGLVVAHLFAGVEFSNSRTSFLVGVECFGFFFEFQVWDERNNLTVSMIFKESTFKLLFRAENEKIIILSWTH